MLTNAQFDRARRLALRLAGIDLHERQRELVERRLCRLGFGEPAALDTFLDAAEVGDDDARRTLVGLVTTNVTEFFRHPLHFELAVERALTSVRGCGQARLWSAAAATGEEPYSLAIAVLEAFGGEDPPVRILASDLDEEALACAARGEFSERELRGVAPERRARFFAPTRSGRWSIAPAARRLVEFRPVNLADGAWPIEGVFDVILCRNVLMYLTSSHRQAALEQCAARLAPDGLLVLDPTEHLGPAAALFGPGKDGVYGLRRAAVAWPTASVPSLRPAPAIV